MWAERTVDCGAFRRRHLLGELFCVVRKAYKMLIPSLHSLIKPFLAIGTALVRLEGVVKALTSSPEPATKSTRIQRRQDEPSSTSHAVAASLSTFLAWAREELSSLRRSDSSSPSTEATADAGLLALSSRLETLRTTLASLATLFSRPITHSPPYPLLQLATPSLLSHLYENLQYHLQHSLIPPLMEQAVAAWLFDGAVRDWWRGWEDWLGVREDTKEMDWAMLGIEARQRIKKKSGRSLDDEDEQVDEGETEYIVSRLRLFHKALADPILAASHLSTPAFLASSCRC
jgi:hypothetical protein